MTISMPGMPPCPWHPQGSVDLPGRKGQGRSADNQQHTTPKTMHSFTLRQPCDAEVRALVAVDGCILTLKLFHLRVVEARANRASRHSAPSRCWEK